MIYDIRQVTTYRYASPVAYARHVLRLTPIDRMGQRVHAAALDIEPIPVERREGHDFFGNRMTWVELDRPHDTLSVQVAARVAVKRDIALEATPPWEAIRDAAFASVDLSPNSPAHYLFSSRQVSLDPEIRAYAAESFAVGRPILDAAVDLMRRIKADFTYEIGATTASTMPPMSFALRRGVCQDFAHVMISGMRGLGLPAAYVSGYLRTIPPPGKPRLQGADATHAWVSVWCGAEIGWVGFDPTNDLLVENDHIILAVGRDFSDVSPVDGIIVGSRKQKLAVAVDVLLIE
jgi:transglutaminase-like putative cysteine protease